jgi:hypothetical protein
MSPNSKPSTRTIARRGTQFHQERQPYRARIRKKLLVQSDPAGEIDAAGSRHGDDEQTLKKLDPILG